MKKYKHIALVLVGLFIGVIITTDITSAAQGSTTRVRCGDGSRQTARQGMAAPNNELNRKDYEVACRGKGGYKAESATGSTLQNPVAGNDCGGVDTAIIRCNQDNSGNKVENNAIWGLLLMALNILTAGVGVLAVAGIVYGAVLYTTAEDKADQVRKAIDIITNVVIGLIAFALMYAGLNFLIPGGIFS